MPRFLLSLYPGAPSLYPHVQKEFQSRREALVFARARARHYPHYTLEYINDDDERKKS